MSEFSIIYVCREKFKVVYKFNMTFYFNAMVSFIADETDLNVAIIIEFATLLFQK